MILLKNFFFNLVGEMSSGEVTTEDVRFNCREDSRKQHCLTIKRDSTSETARDRKTRELRG